MWRRLVGFVAAGMLGAALMATPSGAPTGTPSAAAAETASAAARVAATSVDNPRFPLSRGLKTQVKFWKRIFARYSKYSLVVHDTLHLDRIYSVVDYASLARDGMSDEDVGLALKEAERQEKERIRDLLLRLHTLGSEAATAELSPEESRIRALFDRDPGETKFLDAAADDRLRGQRGLRERFRDAIAIARRYLPGMEAEFARAGVPRELTRLPLVESCFNVNAYSKVGAAGMWQFMPDTARRQGLLVNDLVDERRDPFASTRAAARYLKADFEALGSWPLAVTAYNHGRAGMARAVVEVGSSDLVTIIREFRGPTFKFASRNFYAEFLAALDVEQHQERYFGRFPPAEPLRPETFELTHFVPLSELTRCADLAPEELLELNPALRKDARSDKLYVPRGYRLRLPQGTLARFEERYASLPDEVKRDAQRRLWVAHRVQRGQTLASIARRYGVSVASILRSNRLSRGRVRVGQSLVIPAA